MVQSLIQTPYKNVHNGKNKEKIGKNNMKKNQRLSYCSYGRSSYKANVKCS